MCMCVRVCVCVCRELLLVCVMRGVDAGMGVCVHLGMGVSVV